LKRESGTPYLLVASLPGLLLRATAAEEAKRDALIPIVSTSVSTVQLLVTHFVTQGMAELSGNNVIADNLSAHKTKKVSEFLAANPAVRIYYTPAYSSWLNEVEIWFSKIQRDLMPVGSSPP
jgi:DDE superfamily endonuclease